jgi:hypothetical protein
MSNLKPMYDAALNADAEVKRVLNEMDTLFNDGTEDGKKKALELRPALDEAKNKAEQANLLYVSMRDASLTTDNSAALFTPPADPATQDPKDANPKAMNRAAFNLLHPVEQAAFVTGGGIVED